MADTPETSEYTSIAERIKAITEEKYQSAPLFPFIGNPREDMPEGLPFEFTDYLALVDWTGRILRDDKRGAISNQLSPILQRLNFNTQQWLTLTSQFEHKTRLLVGEQETVNENAHYFSYKRVPASAEFQTFTT